MPDTLVTIGLYSSLFEAHLARAELETFEIDASLSDEYTIGVNWQWRNLLGGVRLQVPESQAEEANGVLQAERVEHDIPEAIDPLCGKCGSDDTHYILARRGAILTWLVLGVPIIPVASKQVCANCGHRWKL